MKVYIDRISEEGILLIGEESPEILELEDSEEQFRNKIAVSMMAYKISGNLIISGTLSTQVMLVCSCCLKEFSYLIENKKFTYDCEIEGRDIIDLTEPIREDIIVGLPLRPLCREDCRGLCTHCGKNLNEGECGCKRSSDPPNAFGVLDKLL